MSPFRPQPYISHPEWDVKERRDRKNGIMEGWNKGRMEELNNGRTKRNDGMMEEWKNWDLFVFQWSGIPIFQHSFIPIFLRY